MAKIEYLNYNLVKRNDWDLREDEIFERARDMDLDDSDYGILEVDENDSILESAEDEGKDWPYGCRQGMCASCVAFVISGDIDISGQMVLSQEEIDRDARVTCIGTPDAEEVQLVYNAQDELGD